MAVYAIVVGGMLLVYVFAVPAEEKRDDRWWTTPLDTLLFVLALAGMLLLAMDHDSLLTKSIWKVVSPTLVAAQLFLNVRARAQSMREPAQQPHQHVRTGDLGIAVFVAPTLALNLFYAFGT